jgi:hypothetical protein
MQFYINDFGKPIIPKCGNCAQWVKVNPKEKSSTIGYCKLSKLSFAFTRKESVYSMTKDFYWCENHQHINAEKLEKNGIVREYDDIEQAVAEIKK